MVNFMCQLDWATGCPYIWSNIILGVSVRVFLDEINIKIGRLSKADCPPYCGWVSSNQLKAWIEPKRLTLLEKESSFLPDCLWTGTLASFLPSDLNWNTGSFWVSCLLAFDWNYSIASLGSQAFRLGLELHHQLSCYFQLADSPWRSRDLSASIVMWANSL